MPHSIHFTEDLSQNLLRFPAPAGHVPKTSFARARHAVIFRQIVISSGLTDCMRRIESIQSDSARRERRRAEVLKSKAESVRLPRGDRARTSASPTGRTSRRRTCPRTSSRRARGRRGSESRHRESRSECRDGPSCARRSPIP